MDLTSADHTWNFNFKTVTDMWISIAFEMSL